MELSLFDVASIGMGVRPRPRPVRKPIATLGSITLLDRVPCGPDDECYLGMDPNNREVFVRAISSARLADGYEKKLRRSTRVMLKGVVAPSSWFVDGGRIYILSRIVHGIALPAFEDRVSWPIALALVHDVAIRLAQLRALVRVDVTPARVRLATDGSVYVCLGAPSGDRDWSRGIANILGALLGLAATDEERVLLDGILTGEGDRSLAIASDLLVERHPEIDALFPALLLPFGGFDTSLDVARKQLIPLVPHEDLRAFWELVISRS